MTHAVYVVLQNTIHVPTHIHTYDTRCNHIRPHPHTHTHTPTWCGVPYAHHIPICMKSRDIMYALTCAWCNAMTRGKSHVRRRSKLWSCIRVLREITNALSVVNAWTVYSKCNGVCKVGGDGARSVWCGNAYVLWNCLYLCDHNYLI